MRRWFSVVVLSLGLLSACASLTPGAAPIRVRVLAINDFHGHLKPPSEGFSLPDPDNPQRPQRIAVGGAAHLATAVAQLGAGEVPSVFVAAGDLVGASPLLSAMFGDEPTITSLSRMGLMASAVGNHEFDQGLAHLLHLQQGGCERGDCRERPPFAGAGFQYLAASTFDSATGKTVLPPYVIRYFSGVPVAFIGLSLRATPTMVVPAGVRGLTFADEAATVNALVPGLRAQGVEAIVVLIHEGGWPVGQFNHCAGISGPIVDIVQRLDRAVDLVISGHTHQAYTCRIDGRLVTSGDKFGTMVTQIDLTLDPHTRDVREAVAENVLVRHDRFAADAGQTALIAKYEAHLGPLAQRPIGKLAAALSREQEANGESPLGRCVADAQLAATRDAGAVLALTNPGGIRNSLALPADGWVRYEALYAVQPFGNALQTLTLSGAQLQRLLEQQWQDPAKARILQVSQGFSYQWSEARPIGQRIVPGSLRLNGRAITPEMSLRVTVNAFLAGGGDRFSVLTEASEHQVGMQDVDALAAYFQVQGEVKPARDVRIERVD